MRPQTGKPHQPAREAWKRVVAASLSLVVPAMLCAGCGRPSSAAGEAGGFEAIGDAPVRTFLPPGRVVSELKEEIPELMRLADIPGLSVAFVRGGEVVWTGGFGVRRRGASGEVTSGTVFEACSLSKPVFAWAVMKMVEEGSIDLDRPLYEYTGERFIETEFLLGKASDVRIWQVTARHVLAHMTGMPNWRHNGPVTFSFDPGKGFGYSGEGYVLLQAVVEKIKGRRLEDLMREYVLDPLGMDSSSYVWRDDFYSTAAFPHSAAGMPRGLRIRRRASAAASLYTTAADFGRFMSAVLRGEGLSRETVEEIFSSQCMLRTETPGVMSWGLGFGLQDVGSERSFWHWGDNGEYRCCMLAYEGYDSGIVYFTNSENGLAIAEEMVNLALGGQNPLFESDLMKGYAGTGSPRLRVVRAAVYESAEQAAGLIRAEAEAGGEEATGEYLINGLGYRLMGEGRTGEAIVLFKLNTELYPESFNVYDSLGEAYMKLGLRELAMENYERSLSIRPDSPSGRWALRRMRFIPEDMVVPEVVEADSFTLRMVEGEEAAGPAGSGRYSFTWAVIGRSGEQLGTVQVGPSYREDYDAVVTFEVSGEAPGADLEDSLEGFLRKWISLDWPFGRVAWPGRDMSWEEFRGRG